MSNWKKTQCCGTCALWRLYDTRKSGRVLPSDGGNCRWLWPAMDLPDAVTKSFQFRLPDAKNQCMRRDDGANCPCYERKEEACAKG